MSTAPGEVACPECGKTATRQLHAGAGFVFKGSGFYQTDYRSSSYKEAAKSEKGSDSGAKASGDASPGGKADKSPKGEKRGRDSKVEKPKADRGGGTASADSSPKPKSKASDS